METRLSKSQLRKYGTVVNGRIVNIHRADVLL